MNCFCASDILLPTTDPARWAVIACDQFTAQPDYWQRVEQTVGQAPSTLRLVLPEAWLGQVPEEEAAAAIQRTMDDYLARGVLQPLPESFIYVERTLQDGRIRRGLVGAVDLEAYDWRPGAQTPIRATEGTVPDRLPPRIRVRQAASLELPHILMLADDPADLLLGALTAQRDQLPLCYDVELMEQGGHLRGWQVTGAARRALEDRLAAYEAATALPYVVGDGNHSLAAARACWEALRTQVGPNHPARYALVELENIRDPALCFEPIHRLVTGVDPQALLAALSAQATPTGETVRWITGQGSGTLHLGPGLAVGALQAFLDDYGQGSVDYIHGDEVLTRLAQQPQTVGFLLPPLDKGLLFPSIADRGALPRKTFSMGHATEKRYYMEGRRIR